MTTDAVALVTGANRGIGLEVCRQLAERGYHVILGARSLEKGQATAAQLEREGVRVYPRQLDVADEGSVRALAAALETHDGRLDVLVNNAGIHYDTFQRVLNADLTVVREALETNTLGPWRTVQAFLPLLRRSAHGRIVNVSSEAGSWHSLTGDARLQPLESRSERSHDHDGGGTPQLTHPRQRRLSRLGRDRHGRCGRQAGHPGSCECRVGRHAPR